MSTKLPMTYIYEFGDISADHRRFILAEFAANGIRNLVFTDEWIARIMHPIFRTRGCIKLSWFDIAVPEIF